jgi:hypothetical protein
VRTAVRVGRVLVFAGTQELMALLFGPDVSVCEEVQGERENLERAAAKSGMPPGTGTPLLWSIRIASQVSSRCGCRTVK